MSGVRTEGDREVCDECGDSWDKKSTQAIYGHHCPREALPEQVLNLNERNGGFPPSSDEWAGLVELAREALP